MKVETEPKEDLMKFRVTRELKEKFVAAAKDADLPYSQLMRKLMVDFVKKAEKTKKFN